ncbi:MAG: thiamine pyrophosphate-dependent enzyme [Candidatus Omnitrophota bacterium]
MFRRICLIRYFEIEAARAWKDGFIKSPLYLSAGQEAIAAAVSVMIPGYNIFGQHRAHSVYLAFGGDPVKLIDELLGRPTGCTGGKGGSAMIHDPAINMAGHHGLIGENVPLAAGFALGSGRKTVAFFGDAAAEEDYALAAIGFSSTHKLPVLFICEDNDLSILTPVKVRRNWNMVDTVRALKVPAVDIADDPWLIAHHTKELIKDLPAFINCRTCRHFWHVGAGVDGPPEWDRFALVKKELDGLKIDHGDIEADTERLVKGLWQERLRRL